MGSTPVAWMTNTVYLLVIFIGILFALAFRTYVMRLRKTLFLFDTIGIAVFTVLGLQKSLNVGIDPIIAIMMGMVSAVFGGVIRDIVCNEIPLIFQKEIYALVCIAGGALYVILLSLHFDDNLVLVISTAFIIVFRILSVIKKWHLPTIY
ncbi:MAG: putative membrane protein YeiH [Paraglaciecola sp.]